MAFAVFKSAPSGVLDMICALNSGAGVKYCRGVAVRLGAAFFFDSLKLLQSDLVFWAAHGLFDCDQIVQRNDLARKAKQLNRYGRGFYPFK